MVKSSWWRMLVGATTRHRQNTTRMRDRMMGSALLLFGQFIISSVIYMVAHLP
jgi:hypothetical protein